MALINLRNALMTGKRLPYDAEVEYLESTGTQWIDTGIIFSADNGFSITYSPTNADTYVDNSSIFGSRTDNGNTRMMVGFNANAGGTRGVGCKVYVGWGVLAIPISDNRVAKIGSWYTATANISTATATDGIGATASLSTLPTQTRPAYIFGANTQSGPLLCRSRIAACEIYQSGVLVRDYIPVRKGTVGYLYDRVSGKLFGNAGTGDFVVGQDVVPVEYIESHGTERIDTGFKADNTCKFRIDMERRGGSAYWLFGSRNGTSTATDKSCLYASVNSSIGYAMMGSAMPLFNSTLIKYGKHMIEMSLADGLVIDGDVSATYTASEQAEVFTNSYPMSIFTMYNGSMYFNAFTGRVYLFSITSGGVSRLNLLPVRVGTEGAMMDVLTRRIYRNAGSGAFAYGNDLKYPIQA